MHPPRRERRTAYASHRGAPPSTWSRAGIALSSTVLLLPVVLGARIALLELVLPCLGLDGREAEGTLPHLLAWPLYGFGPEGAQLVALFIACGGLLAYFLGGSAIWFWWNAPMHRQPHALRVGLRSLAAAAALSALLLAWSDSFAASLGVVRTDLSLQGHYLDLEPEQSEWFFPLLQARDQAVHPRDYVMVFDDDSERQADFGRLPGATRWASLMAALFLGLIPGGCAGWGLTGLSVQLITRRRRSERHTPGAPQ